MSLFNQLGLSKKKWLSRNSVKENEITQASAIQYGVDSATVSTLLGKGKKSAKSRSLVYEKWAEMESDAICSTALSLLVTSALGGHETSGKTVFIEKNALSNDNDKLSKIVDEINLDLSELLNKNASNISYTAAAFGDAYARIYSDKNGVVDVYTDELVRPPLVQPFERGGKTMGFAVYTGERNFERLNTTQMVRMKMPRQQWVPQTGVIEKSLRSSISEDDMEKLPLMPSMAGGSLLYNAEESFDNLQASLMGLVGQRWMDSIDEQILSVNMESMNSDQQKKFIGSLKGMLTKSKTLAEKSVKEGRPIMEKIRHVIPVFNEKQVTQISSGGESGRSGTISIDDVMLHAKLLSGAIGVDLSLLGFSEQLSGGFGDGGFFRVSAQAAERARIIRKSLEEFFIQIIDIHTLNKYGFVFAPKDRPFQVNFYGSISALEAEKETTNANKMNAGLLLVQAMQGMKDLGADKNMMEVFLSKQMALDEEQAKLFAAITEAAKEEDGGY